MDTAGAASSLRTQLQIQVKPSGPVFQEAEVSYEGDDEGDEEDDDEDGAVWTREPTISTLATQAKTAKSEQNRWLSVLSFLQLVKSGYVRIAASTLVAEGAERGVHFARSLRAWATLCLEGEELSSSQTGKHAKRRSYLQDKDCILPLREYHRAKKFNVEVSALIEHVNKNILPRLGYAPSHTVSEKIVTRWLHSLDINYRAVAKGKYIDGHEWEDVIAYW
ncbi:unnamed protein product [Albugo candida]|uniref:Uncharacterized protein n=1 Tax=Albugo candida TaxID=65357 RepID=A0A024FVP3_9STRA|nr:unnamed protein product [Albugo candida]|eukprot:CCI10967.1 unnamed protein product [Albugo candida]